jgi:MraZ protein
LDDLFTGNATNKIDAKGRVSMPPDFRRILDAEEKPGFYLVPSIYNDGCIEGMGQRRFQRFARAIDRMRPGDPRTRALKDSFIGMSIRMQIEDNGRITLTPSLRELLGNPGEIFFLGAGQSFEVWNPQTYARVRLERSQLAAENFDLISFEDEPEEVA